MEIVIRRGEVRDLEAVRQIQTRSSGAAQWEAEDYLLQEFLVAVESGRVVGFLVARRLAEGESEILNLAVESGFRRKGVARELFGAWFGEVSGSVFLEVRESNQTGRDFYQALGFKEVGRRPAYYNNPREAAIVLKFHSC